MVSWLQSSLEQMVHILHDNPVMQQYMVNLLPSKIFTVLLVSYYNHIRYQLTLQYGNWQTELKTFNADGKV